jgi:hypothetical protein
MDSVANQSQEVEYTNYKEDDQLAYYKRKFGIIPPEAKKKNVNQFSEEITRSIAAIIRKAAAKFNRYNYIKMDALIDRIVTNKNLVIEDIYRNNPELVAFENKYNIGGLALCVLTRWLKAATRPGEKFPDTDEFGYPENPEHTELINTQFVKIMDVVFENMNMAQGLFRTTTHSVSPCVYAPKSMSTEDEKELETLRGVVHQAVHQMVGKMVDINRKKHGF